MRLGDFPKEQTLDYRLGQDEDIFTKIDATCPPDMPFALATNMREETALETYDYAKKFYTAHTDRLSLPDAHHVAEPLYFALHVAKLLQGSAIKSTCRQMPNGIYGPKLEVNLSTGI